MSNVETWPLSFSLIKDFVYRNPEREKGKEFSDVVVIYDDTVIIIQIKAQESSKKSLRVGRKEFTKRECGYYNFRKYTLSLFKRSYKGGDRKKM